VTHDPKADDNLPLRYNEAKQMLLAFALLFALFVVDWILG
jgi:hypothetical protein